MKLTPLQQYTKWTIENNVFTIIHAERQQGLTTCFLKTAIEECKENANHHVLYLVDNYYIIRDIINECKRMMNQVEYTIVGNEIRFSNGSLLVLSPIVVCGFCANMVIMDNYDFSKETLFALLPTLCVAKGKIAIGHSSDDSINLPSYFLNLLGTKISKNHKKVDWRGLAKISSVAKYQQ